MSNFTRLAAPPGFIRGTLRKLALCCLTLSSLGISEAAAQLSLEARGNVIFVDYETQGAATSELSLISAVGGEFRWHIVALGVAAEAYSPPTVDLIVGGRLSLSVYPLTLGPLELLATANVGIVSGEDIGGGLTAGYGGGITLGFRTVRLVALVRRVHFSFYDDVALRGGMFEITAGPRVVF
jgi:hypothetical protein